MLNHLSRVWLCDPMDHSSPASSVHGILQARILEWVAMPSSADLPSPRERTWVFCVTCIASRFFTHWATWEAKNDTVASLNTNISANNFVFIFINEYISKWRRQWQPTPVLLPGKSHGRSSLVGCSPWGHAKSRTQLSDFTFTFHFHTLEKEMAPHSSVLIPGTAEPGGLLSMGSHRVRHDWSNLVAPAAADFQILCLDFSL